MKFNKKFNKKFNTTTYNYNNNEKELVFCYRNRPFAVLQSSFLPTPTSTYIDHQLVMELGMKMTDVNCKKISFAGQKLRFLGRVSFSAQCVNDGNIFGSYQFKASVIENLQQHFDTHAIAGAKMTTFLHGDCSSTSSRSSTPSRATPSPSLSPTPPHARPSAPSPGHARPSAHPHGHAKPPAPHHAHHRQPLHQVFQPNLDINLLLTLLLVLLILSSTSLSLCLI